MMNSMMERISKACTYTIKFPFVQPNCHLHLFVLPLLIQLYASIDLNQIIADFYYIW